MSHVFAPVTEATENRSQCVVLKGVFKTMSDIAEKRYNEAMNIAERIDEKIEAETATAIPFNKNAVLAASLLAFACVRASQVS